MICSARESRITREERTPCDPLLPLTLYDVTSPHIRTLTGPIVLSINTLAVLYGRHQQTTRRSLQDPCLERAFANPRLIDKARILKEARLYRKIGAFWRRRWQVVCLYLSYLTMGAYCLLRHPAFRGTGRRHRNLCSPPAHARLAEHSYHTWALMSSPSKSERVWCASH
jgi:hypothetical protein